MVLGEATPAYRDPGLRSGAVTWWSADADGVTLRVRATPNGRRSEVLGVAGCRLRVRLQAPAVEGKANAELVRFVAVAFGVRRSAVTLVRGDRSREKSVYVAGASVPPAGWG